jgi:hypothetical protein
MQNYNEEDWENYWIDPISDLHLRNECIKEYYDYVKWVDTYEFIESLPLKEEL